MHVMLVHGQVASIRDKLGVLAGFLRILIARKVLEKHFEF
jgi:hypothetical protein